MDFFFPVGWWRVWHWEQLHHTECCQHSAYAETTGWLSSYITGGVTVCMFGWAYICVHCCCISYIQICEKSVNVWACDDQCFLWAWLAACYPCVKRSLLWDLFSHYKSKISQCSVRSTPHSFHLTHCENLHYHLYHTTYSRGFFEHVGRESYLSGALVVM